jgi:hypothetical protein
MTIQEVIKDLIPRFKGCESLEHWKDEDSWSNFCHSMLSGGIGMQIRNEFELWDKESELHKLFLEKNIEHPDDMSDYLIRECYKQYNKLIKVEERKDKLDNIK